MEDTGQTDQEPQNTPALATYQPVPKLVASAGQEWRRQPNNPAILELISDTGLVIGYKDDLNNYYKATTPTDIRTYCSPEEMDLIMAKVSEGKTLAYLANNSPYSLQQFKHWLRKNLEFKQRYEDALWGAGHQAWEKAEILAQELAEGIPHKPTADSKANALSYYTSTRDKLLKDEFMVKVKQEQQHDKTVTIVFQSKEEYTDEDRARLAKEVTGVSHGD